MGERGEQTVSTGREAGELTISGQDSFSPLPHVCVSVRCPILLNKCMDTTYHTPGTLLSTFMYITQLILKIRPLGKEVLS